MRKKKRKRLCAAAAALLFSFSVLGGSSVVSASEGQDLKSIMDILTGESKRIQADYGLEEEEQNGSSSSSGGSDGGSRQLVAEPLSSSTVQQSDLSVMDLLYYAQDEMTVGGLSTSGGSQVRSLSGEGADYDVLYAYVEMLCEEYDFQLVDTPYKNVISSTFFDFALEYTGSQTLTGDKIESTYSDNQCDIMIYGTIERDRLKGAIWYNQSLVLENTGYVYGSSSSGKTLVGDSATAGLYQLSDGSFETTDGRLSVSVGEAAVIRDGSAYSYTARFVRDLDAGKQFFILENEYGVEQLEFYFSTTRELTGGAIYTEEEFIIEADYEVSKQGTHDSIPNYTWTTMFAILHNENYIIPIRGMTNELQHLNVRILYVEDEVAVVHVGAQFNTAPYEVEMLLAVFIGTDTTSENKADEEYTVYTGESIDLTGPYEFDSSYHLWTWTVTEGSTIVELTGSNAQSCNVKALKQGTARLTVTYEYSTEEPDVLTGIDRTVGHSTTVEYEITIVDK